MVPLNICSFLFFLLGVLYMDFRIDQAILGSKPLVDDRVLGYAFVHYQISSFADDWFKLIFPLTIVSVFVSIIARTYKTRAAIDCIVLFVFLFLGAMFVVLLIPTYDKMDREYNNCMDPFEYVYSAKDTMTTTHQRLFFIANLHVIIIMLCAILLFLMQHAHNQQD